MMKERINQYIKEAEQLFDSVYDSQLKVNTRPTSSRRKLLNNAVFWILWGGVFVLGFIAEQKLLPARAIGVLWVLWLVGFIGLWIAFKPPKAKPSLWRQMAKSLQMNYLPDINEQVFPDGVQEAIDWQFLPSMKVKEVFWKEQEHIVVDVLRVGWNRENGEWRSPGFYGFICSCHLRTAIQGTTIIVSDSLNAKMKGKQQRLKRVKLEWLQFEEAFDVFSSAEQEVRVVLQPDLMEALYNFYQAMQNPSLCVIFHKDRVSCFYRVGTEAGLLEKEHLHFVFTQLYLLGHFPVLLSHKMLRADWQEVSYIQKRRQDQQDTERALLPINIPDKQGLTPIMHSILDNKGEQFAEFLTIEELDINQRYAGNGNTLLHLAVANNRLEMVKALLSLPQLTYNATNAAGKTALDLAKERRYEDIVHLLETYQEPLK